MGRFEGSNGHDTLVGTDDDDGFVRLGKGNDTVDGKGDFDFVSYLDDGGPNGIVAHLGPGNNSTIIDTYGDTDTIISVHGINGSRNGDRFIVAAGTDYNIQPDRGADEIIIEGKPDFLTIDYQWYFDDSVVAFVRELSLDITGIQVDFGAGTITEYNGTIDRFTPTENIRITGTAFNDIMIGADDGIAARFSGFLGHDYLVAGDRFDRVDYRNEGNEIGSGFTINLVTGKVTNGVNSDVDTLVNFRFVEGSNYSDVIIGSGFDERFVATRGDDQIDGGAGVDWVHYWDYDRSDLNVTGIGSGVVTVTGANLGTHTLTNIERLEFSNGILALDIEGNAGQAYRLYKAAFDRTPDIDGLKYWIDRLDSGTLSLAAVAASFLDAPEFANTYGTEQTVSNGDFIALLYQHALGRPLDQEGYDYWVGKLEAKSTTRSDLLAFFSESNENKANVADSISDGIWLS